MPISEAQQPQPRPRPDKTRPRNGTAKKNNLFSWHILLYGAGFIPAAFLFYQGIEGQLGADPVNIFERALGLWAFRFLMLCLLVTPLYQATGWKILAYRRLLGLLAFFYACFHLLAYLALDNGFVFSILLQDITKRPFIMLGMGGFLLLLPLALTSNRFAMKRLGARWKKLHRLIYPAACLLAVHFVLAFKTLNDLSLFYVLLLAVLFAVRLVRWIGHYARKQKRKSPVYSVRSGG